MKTILYLILFIPTLMFGQVSSWRTNPPQQSQSQTRVESPKIQQNIPQQQNNVSSWRTQTAPIRPGDRFNQQQPIRRFRPTIVNPYGLMWGNWGWYQPYPYIWYDDFGWRQRSEIRVYENGKRDTISKPLYYTLGLGYTNNKQTSFWGAIGGKKGYFILDYTMSYDIDHNQYYPYGKINQVDFPLSKNDFIKQGTMYIGGGKRFGKLGIHGMIGFGNEIIRYQGKDDLGGISFPKSNSNFTTFKFGIIRDFKFFTLKLDRDPIRNFNQISIGLHNQ
jgi:hypothetical protein